MVNVFYHFRNSVKCVTALQDYVDFCDSEYKTLLKHCVKLDDCHLIKLWFKCLTYRLVCALTFVAILNQES